MQTLILILVLVLVPDKMQGNEDEQVEKEHTKRTVKETIKRTIVKETIVNNNNNIDYLMQHKTI